MCHGVLLLLCMMPEHKVLLVSTLPHFSIEQMITRSSRYLSDRKGSVSAGEFRCRHAPSPCDHWQ
jgi:hypothetical protein